MSQTLSDQEIKNTNECFEQVEQQKERNRRLQESNDALKRELERENEPSILEEILRFAGGVIESLATGNPLPVIAACAYNVGEDIEEGYEASKS